ncbi:MAG: DUF4872 domain-containing protein [Ardenticatenaceae bacterium]|nr:DUF4872 domain-containing protein [Ardenticatenaceae bacterium]
MPKLNDYQQFNGRHWGTGTVHNFYTYRGVKAPHTGQPYSEALLMGVSGGIVMGYFVFAYEGYDPQARILTRNTFDPWDTYLSRLGVAQHIQHTSKPEKGLANLLDTLEEGIPAIVWTDMFSLPYNAIPPDEQMWAMMPILVYGHDDDVVWIADRARVPLTVTPTELAAARARVKKDKFRLVTLNPPDEEKLATAVTQGIWDCINLYTEKPPKGSKNNFGFAAYQHWADMLVKPKAKRSWAKEFPPGAALYAGLTSAFHDIHIFGKDGHAERDMYANFLDEASLILGKPALKSIAQQFRASADAWDDLGLALLPDEIPLLQETHRLMLQSHRLFLEKRNEGLEERVKINGRLAAIKSQITADFPLNEAGVQALHENIRTHILAIHDVEQKAIAALKDTMA